MIGVDTNVLLRLFVDEDSPQRRAAEAFINAEERKADPAIVTAITIVEIEWVLRSFYKRTKAQIIGALDQLCDHAFVVIEERDAVEVAIDAWRLGKAELAGYLIAALARERGAPTTVTFDRVAAESATFTLLHH